MGTLIDAFSNSDTIGKSIVILLCFGSCIVWSIMLIKVVQTWLIHQRCRRFRTVYRRYAAAPLRIEQEWKHTNLQGPLAVLCHAAIAQLLEILKPDGFQHGKLLLDGVLPRQLTSGELDKIRAALNAAMASEEQQIIEHIPMLGCLSSIAPMLGLFGTVWGVMATFVGIVNAGGRPDIQAIAPGISGALLTTVMGLVVAIPSLCGSNLMASQINQINSEMEIFSEEFIASLRVNEVGAETNSPAPAIVHQ